MSTKKTFKFFFGPYADVTILQAEAYIARIGDTNTTQLYNGEFSPDHNGWRSIDLTGETGDCCYIVLNVLQYVKNNIKYSVAGRSGSGNNWFVEALAVFRWENDIVYINPMATVAATFTFAKRIKIEYGSFVSITGSKNFLDVAFAMKNNFYETGGKVSGVISSSPNALQTNSYASFNFLSNLLYYSLVDVTVFDDFLNCANTVVSVNSDLEAMIVVAQHPFDNVQDIYNLIKDKLQLYSPSLPQLAAAGLDPVPNQWTLAIKINDSGSENFLIAGTAFTVFDKDNKAWVTNNFRQGTPNSGGHCMVFNPDGSPADISPIIGGGILGPGFGVAVSPDGGTIAFGNYGWGNKVYNPVRGSISVFSSDGEVLSPPGGFTNKTCRIQGMCYDPSGNLWMASWGTQAPMEDPTAPSTYDVPGEFSAVVCYLGGDPEKALVYNDFGSGPSEYHGTFGVVIDKEGNCIVSNAGTAGKMPSSVYKIRISANKDKLELVAFWDSVWVGKNPDQIPNFEEFRQPQVDNKGNIYVGGITSGRVVKLNGETLLLEDEFTHNIYGPWGITIDSKGKKFITGFGEKKTVDIPEKTIEWTGPFAITVVESDDETWSDAKLMTLPTAGDEVRLANGQPLYGHQLDKDGDQIPPSYQPLMRVTSTSIDRAGNLWCANNWKPSLYVDVFTDGTANPGGDGIVIFVGVAEPIV